MGPLGISLYKDSTNELICHSVAKYGDGLAPGNERGYVVGIQPCIFGGKGGVAPPRLRRDTVVRVEAFYNTTFAHEGLMSLWLMNIADVPLPDRRVSEAVLSLGPNQQVGKQPNHRIAIM